MKLDSILQQSPLLSHCFAYFATKNQNERSHNLQFPGTIMFPNMEIVLMCDFYPFKYYNKYAPFEWAKYFRLDPRGLWL